MIKWRCFLPLLLCSSVLSGQTKPDFSGVFFRTGVTDSSGVQEDSERQMLVGHFAVSMVGKRVEPTLSLGTLVLASLLPDLLWCVFLLTGIERVQIQPGRGAAKYLALAVVPWSHSLLMVAAWASLFAAAYYLLREVPRGAWVLFGAVVSHWLLDVVSNKDMPLAPGMSARFGLGIWGSVPATLILEGGFWVLGIILYVRATTPKNRAGVFAFWAVIALLTLAWYNNITGPPPPNGLVMGISSLIFFSLLVTWA